MNAEYKRRATSQCSDNSASCLSSTFCLFVKQGKEAAIKIEKYNDVLNCFEKVLEIRLGPRVNFGVVMQKNEIFVLGGMEQYGSKNFFKSVGFIANYKKNCEELIF